MKSLLVCVLFLVFCQACKVHAEGIPANSLFIAGASGESTTCDPTNGILVGCSADCLGIDYCVDGETITVNCKDTSPTKLYCNSQTKSCDDKPSCSGSEVAPFKCPASDGTFPDPLNCKNFYYCQGGESDFYQCVGKTIFNPKTSECATGVSCYTFSTINGLCRNKIGQLVVHPLDKSLYALCLEKPRLMKCAGENVFFNPSSLNCQYDCGRKEGRFADTADSTNKKYYECTRSGNIYRAEHKECEDGKVFNKERSICIKQSPGTDNNLSNE